jgi:hypothetical protein
MSGSNQDLLSNYERHTLERCEYAFLEPTVPSLARVI